MDGTVGVERLLFEKRSKNFSVICGPWRGQQMIIHDFQNFRK
jgi:hypothetical protein